jgi:DnaJ-class molecular chaperone
MAANTPLRSRQSVIDLMSAYETYHPSLESLWQHFETNFSPLHAPKSQPERALDIEMMVSHTDAMQGAHFSIDVPVAEVCARCEGSGSTGFFECDLCDGRGITWRRARVIVFIPPQTRDATVIPISLRHLGVKNLFLNVHVRLADA